jgi:hypothetical protein
MEHSNNVRELSESYVDDTIFVCGTQQIIHCGKTVFNGIQQFLSQKVSEYNTYKNSIKQLPIPTPIPTPQPAPRMSY